MEPWEKILIPHNLDQAPRTVADGVAARPAIRVHGPIGQEALGVGNVKSCFPTGWAMALLEEAIGVDHDIVADSLKGAPDERGSFHGAMVVRARDCQERVIAMITAGVRVREAELPGYGKAVDGVFEGEAAGCETARELLAGERLDASAAEDGVCVRINRTG